MARARGDDLEEAARILSAIGLRATASLAAALNQQVEQRHDITWKELQVFLKTFEEETAEKDPTCHRTFNLLEGILMKALEGAGATTQRELRSRALAAPDV